MMIDRLRNFDLNRASLEEAVELSAYGRLFADQFAELGVDLPDWLIARRREISRDVKARIGDLLDKRLREAKIRRDGLLPASDKIGKLDAEIAALEAKLASANG